jgi:hypothetical protein
VSFTVTQSAVRHSAGPHRPAGLRVHGQRRSEAHLMKPHRRTPQERRCPARLSALGAAAARPKNPRPLPDPGTFRCRLPTTPDWAPGLSQPSPLSPYCSARAVSSTVRPPLPLARERESRQSAMKSQVKPPLRPTLHEAQSADLRIVIHRSKAAEFTGSLGQWNGKSPGQMHDLGLIMEPPVGFEPTTSALQG